MPDLTKYPTLVSLDIETSGLDHTKHSILSAAAVQPATGNARDYDIWHDNVLASPQAFRTNKLPFDQLDNVARVEQAHVQAELVAWFNALKHGAKADSLVMLGWNPGSFDHLFLRTQMPHAASAFGHRFLDLNSVCFFLDILRGQPFGTTKKRVQAVFPAQHTAFGDAQDAVHALKFLLEEAAIVAPPIGEVQHG